MALAILPGMNKLDAKPGTLPDIHIGRDGVIFAMQPRGIHDGDVLIIRCDTNGEVWVSIPEPGSGHDAHRQPQQRI